VSNSKSLALALVLAVAASHTAAAQTPATQSAATQNVTRASWLSDRLPVQVGDILTIVVDEQTAASERVSQIASSDRDQAATASASLSTSPLSGSGSGGFGTGLDANSSDIGEAGRQGGLTAVLSVRVMEIEPNGVLRIEGTKQVSVDGREQEITLAGYVRSEDVLATNFVLSTRVAEATISYKGKKIGPKKGIIGKILSIFWP
jgi:flagellar L-ring protein precursor FlgH